MGEVSVQSFHREDDPVQLELLGWNGFFASQLCTGVPGRVAATSRERFVVWR